MLDVSIKENHLSETQVVFVNLKGALDSEKAIDFYDFINAELIKGFRKFVVDCTNLDYISSAGISIMIRLQHKLIQKKSILAYYSFNKEVSLVLNFFGLAKEFPIADNLDNALKLLNLHQEPFEEGEEIYSVHSDTNVTTVNTIQSEAILSDTKQKVEPLNVQFSDVKVASLLDPETAKKIKSNRLTITEDFPVLEDENPTSQIEPVSSEDIKKEAPQYSELKIKLPFITKTETNPAKTTIMDSITDFETDHTERYDVNSLSNVTDTNFTVLVANCGNCGSKIRIRKQGKQKCPICGYKFLLRQSGSISTIERL